MANYNHIASDCDCKQNMPQRQIPAKPCHTDMPQCQMPAKPCHTNMPRRQMPAKPCHTNMPRHQMNISQRQMNMPQCQMPAKPCHTNMPQMEHCPSISNSNGCMDKSDPLAGMAIAMAYVPWQFFQETYEPDKALQYGTIFPELYKPFYGKGGCLK